jgi:hypothetical protein
LALAVPLSRFTSRVGGGSAFYVRRHSHHNNMRLLATIFALLAIHAIASDREPPGSTTYTFIDHTNDTVIYSNSVSGSNWTLKINYPPPPIALPHTFRDVDSGIIFYVESDGRHVTAISPDGTILWSRDPFADSHLEHYRTDTPRIVLIDEVDKSDEPHQWIVKAMAQKGISKFVCITFNSSQSGCLDFKTGDFTFLGQN